MINHSYTIEYADNECRQKKGKIDRWTFGYLGPQDIST
jgi:hypothetical protein